jgi:hypothetical protein
MKQGAKVLN